MGNYFICKSEEKKLARTVEGSQLIRDLKLIQKCIDCAALSGNFSCVCPISESSTDKVVELLTEIGYEVTFNFDNNDIKIEW